MTFPTLDRMAVIERLTNEAGERVTILPWWRLVLDALDDPAKYEFILNLIRQVGKTEFLKCAGTSELLCRPNSYTVMVSASATQQQALYHRKLRRPLERFLDEMGLRDAARFTATGVEIPALNSALECVVSTADTTPGRTITLLLMDEARYIADSVYTALAPSVIGSGGKMIAASTSGPPRGFFYVLLTNPNPGSFVYQSRDNENPRANKGVLDFLRTRLGLVAPAAARRELENEFAEDGDELISTRLIDAAIDDRLGEIPRSTEEAFAFVDLSRKKDLSSCVVVIRVEARRSEAADHLVVASIATWDPKLSPTGETDFASIRAHLGLLPKRFPNLKALRFDEGAESSSISAFCRTHPALALITEGFVGSVDSNMALWGALVARLNAGTLSIPRHERLLGELRGLRREAFAFGSKFRVVDSSRQWHRDVSLALAAAVMAAGDVFRCPHCDDPDCDGQPPFGLMDSPYVIEWYARHPDPDAPGTDDAVAEPIADVETSEDDTPDLNDDVAAVLDEQDDGTSWSGAEIATKMRAAATAAQTVTSSAVARMRQTGDRIRERLTRPPAPAKAKQQRRKLNEFEQHVTKHRSWFPGDPGGGPPGRAGW
jgi:hypothetical protein